MEDLIVEYEGVKGKGLKTLGIKGIKFEKNGEVIEFTSFNELWGKINK